METSLEIRHTKRELVLYVLSALFILNFVLWWDVWHAATPSSSMKTFICYFVPFLLFILYSQQQYLAVDESGITYRNWWITRRVLWRDVASGKLTWEKRNNGFTFSDYDSRVSRVTMVLFDEKREALLRIVLNFGSEEKRLAFRDMMSARLGGATVESDERRPKLFYDDVRDTPSDTNSGRASGSPLR